MGGDLTHHDPPSFSTPVFDPKLGIIHSTHTKINKTVRISMRVLSGKYCRQVVQEWGGDAPLYKVLLSLKNMLLLISITYCIGVGTCRRN